MADFWWRFSVCSFCAVVVLDSGQADVKSRRLPQYNRLRFYNVPAFCRGAVNCSASVDGLFPALIAETALNISSNRVCSECNSPPCAASLPAPAMNRSSRADACRKIWLASSFFATEFPTPASMSLTWFCTCLTARWTWEVTKSCDSPAAAIFDFRTHWEHMARMYGDCGVIGKH